MTTFANIAVTSSCYNITSKSIPGSPPLFFILSLGRGESLGMRLQHLRVTTTMSPLGTNTRVSIACHTRVNLMHVFLFCDTVYTQASASHTFYSTHKIRLAITSNQLKFGLCKLLLSNSSQHSCHSVAMASPANFQEFPSGLLNNITTLLNHNWKSTWNLTKLYKYCVVGVGKYVSRNLRSSWPFCP